LSWRAGTNTLLNERLLPRSGLPPLLTNLADRAPEALQYLGASFGLTQGLFNFWHRSGYGPVYLRQNASDITGYALSSHARAKES
jgi:N-acetyltransferase 10